VVESPGLENRYSLLSRVRIPLSPIQFASFFCFEVSFPVLVDSLVSGLAAVCSFSALSFSFHPSFIKSCPVVSF
jgi:hypothetical protein